MLEQQDPPQHEPGDIGELATRVLSHLRGRRYRPYILAVYSLPFVLASILFAPLTYGLSFVGGAIGVLVIWWPRHIQLAEEFFAANEGFASAAGKLSALRSAKRLDNGEVAVSFSLTQKYEAIRAQRQLLLIHSDFFCILISPTYYWARTDHGRWICDQTANLGVKPFYFDTQTGERTPNDHVVGQTWLYPTRKDPSKPDLRHNYNPAIYTIRRYGVEVLLKNGNALAIQFDSRAESDQAEHLMRSVAGEIVPSADPNDAILPPQRHAAGAAHVDNADEIAAIARRAGEELGRLAAQSVVRSILNRNAGKQAGNATEHQKPYEASKYDSGGRQNKPAGAGERSPGVAQVSSDGPADRNRKESFEDLLRELDKLTGLTAVKATIKALSSMAAANAERRKRGMQVAPQSFHLVFTGNPGTGKTTVARLFSRIFHSLGYLSKGHLIEVDRSGLVGGYLGQTALKTRDVINSAKGGVLFIDEVYSLATRGNDQYGDEAIQILLKSMEDMRDELIVIVAGYDNEMQKFLNSNPGLRSRFREVIHFDDFSFDELYSVFERAVADNQMQLPDEAKQAARKRISELLSDKAYGFGNAREVRRLFELSLERQSIRIMADGVATDEELMTLEASDIVPLDVRGTKGNENSENL